MNTFDSILKDILVAEEYPHDFIGELLGIKKEEEKKEGEEDQIEEDGEKQEGEGEQEDAREEKEEEETDVTEPEECLNFINVLSKRKL